VSLVVVAAIERDVRPAPSNRGVGARDRRLEAAYASEQFGCQSRLGGEPSDEMPGRKVGLHGQIGDRPRRIARERGDCEADTQMGDRRLRPAFE
jgi:hypothetical protein